MIGPRFRLNQHAIPAAALLALAVPTAAALGVERFWDEPAGGTFGEPGNWAGGVAPGSDDIAVFDLPASSYAVGFSAGRSNLQLTVNDGRVTYDLNGHTYTLTSFSTVQDFMSVSIGQPQGRDARLTLTDGTLSGKVMGIGVAYQAQDAGGHGTVTVSTGGVLRSETNNSPPGIIVGYDATGNLNVVNGGRVFSHNIRIATGRSMGTTSDGEVLVSGAGSQVHVANAVQLGNHPGGVGVLRVENGGY